MKDFHFDAISAFENYEIEKMRDGHVVVTTKVVDSSLNYYGKLNELPQTLFENGFLRVGRSAVVNMKYIRQISSYMVTLRNGVKLGVSRNGYAEIRSTYLEWKGQFGDD